MPHVTVDGCRLVYDIEGPDHAPALLLLHSLGTTADLWATQASAWRSSFRVIRYDARGHGRSDAPSGSYSLDQLGHDALALLDATATRRAFVCGVSLGGLVALWLGLHAAERFDGIVAANTAARLGTSERWTDRIRLARTSGLPAMADGVIERWFTERFRRQQPATVAQYRSAFAAGSLDGYVGACAVLRDADLRDVIPRIRVPTLVVTGRHDTATPPADGTRIQSCIAGSRLLELDAAHLSNVEQAEAFSAGVEDFISPEV